MKQIKLVKIIIVLVVSLSVVKLLIACLISTSGFALFKIEKEVEAFSLENRHLQENINNLSSFNYLQSKAQKLGLVSTLAVIDYSVTRTPIALRE